VSGEASLKLLTRERDVVDRRRNGVADERDSDSLRDPVAS
jgi:hypothetical protein